MCGLDDREHLAPGEPSREEDEREPERIRRPSRFHLALVVEGQLFPEEQVLSGQRGSGPEAGAQETHEVDPQPGQHPANKMKKRRDPLHKHADSPASGWAWGHTP